MLQQLIIVNVSKVNMTVILVVQGLTGENKAVTVDGRQSFILTVGCAPACVGPRTAREERAALFRSAAAERIP